MDRNVHTNTVALCALTTDKCLKPVLFSRRKGRTGGQTTVEFALICIPFFAILFAIVDFAQIYFYENSLQNALREACRFATAGRIIQATNSGGGLAYETNSSGIVVPKAINDAFGREASRSTCIKYWFMSNCVLKSIPLGNIQIVSAPTLPGVPPVTVTNSAGRLVLQSGYNVTTNSGIVSTNPAPAVAGPGGVNDYVQITATYQLNTITPVVSMVGGSWGRGTSSWTKYPVYVSAIVKNEPAYLNFEHLAVYTNDP
jgi:hypothetical protein